ncbi:MAG: Clp protease ClpP [Candidatus Fimivivens sp.]|nr:Clp protease ClpP [Candidatus Fimivivens sp.]
MKKTVKNGVPELWLTGYIVSNSDIMVYNWFGIDAVCPKDVLDNLPESGEAIIKIDSPGGDLVAGSSMYTALMSHNGPLTFDIAGMAASAASAAAMASVKAGNKCRMSPMALMMIHNVKCSAEGDYRDMENAAEFLKTANETIINAYCKKTSKPREEIQAMLDKETWFSAAEALEMGLIDEIMFEGEGEPLTPPASALKAQAKTLLNTLPVLPKEAFDRYRAEHPTVDNAAIDRAKALLAIETARF